MPAVAGQHTRRLLPRHRRQQRLPASAAASAAPAGLPPRRQQSRNVRVDGPQVQQRRCGAGLQPREQGGNAEHARARLGMAAAGFGGRQLQRRMGALLLSHRFVVELFKVMLRRTQICAQCFPRTPATALAWPLRDLAAASSSGAWDTNCFHAQGLSQRRHRFR